MPYSISVVDDNRYCLNGMNYLHAVMFCLRCLLCEQLRYGMVSYHLHGTGSAMRRLSNATAQQCDGSAMRRLSNATAQQCDGSAMRRLSNATA